jgi:alpha-ketoglutarate-dependent taurine dioxygenase
MVDFDVRPLAPVIWAEIHGVDLGHDLDDVTIAKIRSILVDRCSRSRSPSTS